MSAEARTQLRAINPDLMVLDVMMPGENGLDLTQALRREGAETLPILLLTARGAPEDRIAGFEAGADDYLGKPFEPRELVLRIRALLRRAPPAAVEAPAGPVRIGDAEFDVERGELRDASGPIRLTGGEAALLTALAANAMRCSRARRSPRPWGWTIPANGRSTCRWCGCAARSRPTRGSRASCTPCAAGATS